MNSIVSIVLPVYNSEKYVTDAIQSIFAQTYQHIELIVIDDGSTDESAEKIKGCFISNPTQIQTFYYYQENQGPSAARNFGVQKSKGDYIAFLDADDLYTNEKIQKQVSFLLKNLEVHVTYNDIQVVDADLNYLNILRSEGDYPDRATFLTNLLFRQVIPAPAGIMIKRECLQTVKYNQNLVYAEDYDFLIRLAKLYTFGYDPGAYYICRRHAENLTNSHHNQVASEKSIVEALGSKKIEKIVFDSAYSYEEQVLMYAKIMYKVDNFIKAKQLLLSISDSSKNPNVFFYLGNLLFKENQYDVAIQYYIKALEFNQNLAEVYNNMSCCYLSQGLFDSAKLCINNALKLRSNYQDAVYNTEMIRKGKKEFKFTDRELRKQLLAYQK